MWTLSDAIVILVPLLFGLQMGLLCLLPVAASELLWFIKLGGFGPLLHLAAFTIAVIIMAAAHKRNAAMPRPQKAVLSGVLFYRRCRRGRAAVSGPAAAGSAESNKLGRF